MKQIPTPEPTTPLFDIDWTKPVIRFDPWHFTADRIELVGAWYIQTSGKPVQRAKTSDRAYMITERDNVLGTATDGNPFVTSSDGLQAWMAR